MAGISLGDSIAIYSAVPVGLSVLLSLHRLISPAASAS